MSDGELVIKARGLTKRFGDFTAVDSLDLSVQRSEVFGFLGPNGCGKSTTIRMLCGLLLPSAGEIEVLGYKIPQDAEALKRRIGYMTQKFSLYEDLSVIENLQFLAAVQGLGKAAARARIDELLQRYWLTDIHQQLAGTLSGGQRQRLALAGAVLHKPDLLLLDEPTSAVDPQSRREFWDSLFELAEAGSTLLVSTHYMDEAERCMRLGFLDAGKLVATGSPTKLMDNLPGQALILDCQQPRQVQASLRDCPGVLATAQIGKALRILIDSTDAQETVQQHLKQANISVQIQPTEANLEDVFVYVTHKPAGAAS
ncbi:ABC transporter ATP-binding protein [Pseudomonas sp. MS19]|uniref:ABC transporter ATP-binding protein n=1 Tax=Pseudomonas sp. MS19 TaxID=2579939 RepID=UPI0015B6DA9F|nr:ABC transporter ATP-binding protein [Pseudomonas sp. MS19]